MFLLFVQNTEVLLGCSGHDEHVQVVKARRKDKEGRLWILLRKQYSLLRSLAISFLA